jgi:hypothetical protein
MQALPAVIAAMPVESPRYGLTAVLKTVSPLANVMIVDQTTVTRNLRLLEKRGCIFFGEKGDDQNGMVLNLILKNLSISFSIYMSCTPFMPNLAVTGGNGAQRHFSPSAWLG